MAWLLFTGVLEFWGAYCAYMHSSICFNPTLLKQTLHRLPAIYARNMYLALIAPVLFNIRTYQETSGSL